MKTETPAWRSGFCDSLMNRPSASPYPEYPKCEQYLAGYLYGEATRVKFAITTASYLAKKERI